MLLDLRRFADRFHKLSEQPETFSLVAEASTYISQDARFAQTPAPVIRDAITAGRCLILLDGLDEISDQATRRRVAGQLPGYRWHSLKAKRLRHERWRKLAVGGVTGLAIGIALYFGAIWFAALPEGDPKKKFLDAVPAIAALLGLLWGLWQVIRGRKRTLWDETWPLPLYTAASSNRLKYQIFARSYLSKARLTYAAL